MADELHVPEAWERLPLARFEGTILVLGATDTGKSTFSRWLADRLREVHGGSGLLDMDPGQSSRLPTTINLYMGRLDAEAALPSATASWFVGSTSPAGHMLPFLAGCVLLASEAAHGGARSLVADTTGLVAESGGGRTLKTSVAESLQAATIIALQREGELEHIIGPMRGDRRFSVHELALAEAVRTRSRQTRANRRRRLFRDYFDSAAERSLPATTPVYAPHPPREGTLLGLLDERGFCLGLGCVVEPGERLRVRTPITTTDCLVALRAGSIRIDPEDGCEID